MRLSAITFFYLFGCEGGEGGGGVLDLSFFPLLSLWQFCYANAPHDPRLKTSWLKGLPHSCISSRPPSLDPPRRLISIQRHTNLLVTKQFKRSIFRPDSSQNQPVEKVIYHP